MPLDPPGPRPPKPNDPTSAVDPSPVQPGARVGGHARAPGPLPEHVGSYRILREIGHGGMGVVYLATRDDVALNRLVALKLVHRGMASPGVLERFERERQVLGALNHPNIARLLDGGTSDRGEPYFVMEYIEGRPVDEYCDARRLTIGERLALFRQVCAAVHHAHQNLVVHRDIKPRNILVTAEGVPKLLDFGIAKLLNPSMAPSLEAPTQTGLRLMTPEYASPEQVKGLPITTATDVYSLGVVLFELLTGHRPYRLRTRVYHEVERIICEEEPQKPSTAITRVEEVDHGGDGALEGPPPAPGAPMSSKHAGGGSQMITPEAVGRARRERPPRLRRALEGDIDNIVLMALRKEPQRRYASVEQFADDIRRHLDGHTVIARPDTPGYRASKFVRRHRGAVFSAGLVVVALLAGLTTTLWFWRDATNKAIDLRASNSELQATLDARRTLAASSIESAQAILNRGLASIARLPDSIDSQREIVGQVRTWLEKTQALVDADNEPRLRETMAEAWHRFGTTQGGRRGQNEGDLAAALESHRRGHDLRATLVQESQGDPERRINLAASKLSIADVLRERDPLGARSAAEQEVDAARDLADAAARELGAVGAVATTPAMTRAATVLSRILGSKADLAFQSKRYDEARTHAQRGLALIETAFADRLAETTTRSAIGTAHYRLAVIEAGADRMGEALRHSRACTAAYEELARTPGRVSDRRRLMNARRQLADLLRSVGDAEVARGDKASANAEFKNSVDAASNALSLAEELCNQSKPEDASATDVRPRIDRALCLESLGLARNRLGEREVAAGHFRAAIADFEAELAKAKQAGKEPPANWLTGAAAAHQELAEALDLTDAAAARAAVTAAQRAIELRSGQVQPGSDPMDSAEIRRSTTVLGHALCAAGDRGQGRAMLVTARDAYLRAASLDAEDRVRLDRIRAELGGDD